MTVKKGILLLPELTSCILHGDLCCFQMWTWQAFIKVQSEPFLDGWSMTPTLQTSLCGAAVTSGLRSCCGCGEERN